LIGNLFDQTSKFDRFIDILSNSCQMFRSDLHVNVGKTIKNTYLTIRSAENRMEMTKINYFVMPNNNKYHCALRIQSSKFKVQSSKFKVQSSKFKVQSSKFKPLYEIDVQHIFPRTKVGVLRASHTIFLSLRVKFE
jgi:hypothetical protein